MSPEQIAYIGDDLIDLPAMHYAGVSACPSDSTEEVKDYCDVVLNKKGGEGAVREFIEMLLKDRELWEKATRNIINKGND